MGLIWQRLLGDQIRQIGKCTKRTRIDIKAWPRPAFGECTKRIILMKRYRVAIKLFALFAIHLHCWFIFAAKSFGILYCTYMRTNIAILCFTRQTRPSEISYKALPCIASLEILQDGDKAPILPYLHSVQWIACERQQCIAINIGEAKEEAEKEDFEQHCCLSQATHCTESR